MRNAEQVAAMACPVCKVGLVMSDRQGVEIDYCPQCRGVWLDRGELDKIIERSGAELAPPPPPQRAAAPQYQESYRDHGYRGGYDPRKRKKSFLEQIFD